MQCAITNSIVSALYCYSDKTRENKHLILVVRERVSERGRPSLNMKITSVYLLMIPHPFFFRTMTRTNTTTIPAAALRASTIGVPLSP